MRKSMKAVLLLMIALTAIYVSAVVYANTNSYDYADEYRHDVVYAAFKHEYDTPPTKWYTPEELGIVKVLEISERALYIVVDREKEPFSFFDQQTIFLYKGEFYTVAHLCILTVGSENIAWQFPIGGALGVGWVFTGVLLLKGRKKE